MAILTPFVLLILIGGCLSAPLDGPVRVELPVYDYPQESTLKDMLQLPNDENSIVLAEPLEPENYPGGTPLNTLTVSHKQQTKSNLFDHNQGSKHSILDFGGPFSAPITTRETVLLETEGYASKTLSVKDNIHNVAAGLFQPKPIVDTISESEKYGNTGDKFYVAGKAIVGSAEGFANLINAALEIPSAIFKKITRTATEKLNNFGGRLVGL